MDRRSEDGTLATATTTTAVTTTTSSEPGTAPPPPGVPPAPSNVVVQAPSYLGDTKDRVSVRLSWKAPAGAAVIGYRIRHRQRWTAKCDVPAGSDEPIVIRVGPATTSTQYSDTQMPCGWVAWEVAAETTSGVGPYAPATGVLPDVVGVPKSFHLVRAVGGLASGTIRAGCNEDPALACESSPSANTRIEPGTLVAVYLAS